MKSIEIDAVRDVATKIMHKNPRLAFELFSMCLKFRPDGGYLKQKYSYLKDLLNIKSFIVLGNCQSLPISELIESKNNAFHVVSSFREFEMREINEIPIEFHHVDYIITQHLGEHFGVFGTSNLKSLFSDKITVIPNCFFKGFHQDWNYFNHIGPSGDNINRFQSPIGDYHNQTVYDSFIEGLDVDSTLARLDDIDFNRNKYGNVAKESFNELINREKNTDVSISDYIESELDSEFGLFHSFNHPRKKLLNELVNRVLDKLSLDYNSEPSAGECLDWDILSENIINGKRSPIIKRGNVYDDRSFIEDSFKIYREFHGDS